MGFFDFLKKKEEVKEEVLLKELGNWLNYQKKDFSGQEEKISDSIFLVISQLTEELKLEIVVLMNFDLDISKVEDRIKFIVKENLKNYISYLERLIEKLNKIEKGKKIVERVNFVLEDFKKKSHVSYEKVTFIIGKEMRATKESLNKFVDGLENILKLNKDFLEKSELINSIDFKIFSELGTEREKAIINLKEYIDNKKKLEESLGNKKREIEEIRNSEEYILEIKKKEALEFKKGELKEAFNNLRMKLDFKFLLSFYHTFEKEMVFVKGFKDDFRESLEIYGFDKLEILLKESKLFNDEISGLIKNIDSIEKEIKEIIIKDYGIDFLKRDVERVKSEIETLNLEIKTREKRIDGLEKEIDSLINLFRKKLSVIGVDLKIIM